MKTVLAGVMVLVCACGSNQSGNVGASKMGDTTHPAVRSSPLEELRTACSPGDMLPAAATLARRPYVQSVTTSSAWIGWIATGDSSVEVTQPDGKAINATTTRDDRKQSWASVEGLEPDTIYCYRVMVGGQPVTERIGFRTAPTAESTRTIGILAFGDSGSASEDQFSLRSQMDDVAYQLIVHTGDIAYESGSLDQFQSTVFDVYDELFRHVPIFPSAGNHDYKTSDAAPFREVFKLPENGKNEMWYSYDWGRIHFVALDTESDYATQAAWLDKDLAATQLPWKIVYMHRPMYSSGNHGSDIQLRAHLAPLLEKHHVQLVLMGHDHDYERMVPQKGVAYVVTGGGGRGTYDVGTSSFTAFSDSVIHFVYIEVKVDELVLHAIDAEGIEFDSLVVAR